MAEAAFVIVFLGLAIVAPIVLYYLVRAEHDRRDTMTRQEAEEAARRDRHDRK